MASFATTRRNRLALGAAIFAAGVAMLVARPGIALAHHVTVTESGACAGWTAKAEYFGGNGDRKVVVDVTINGEHISATFYFDLDPGHLGHTDYYLLYDRAGSGPLHTSGTVVMYEKAGGSYSNLVNSAPLGTNFDCAPPASTPQATATPTLPPPTGTATSTLVAPTGTATSTATAVANTATPQPTRTPASNTTDIITEETVTPLSTATSTPVTTAATATPGSTRTAVTTGGLETPGPQSTPTLVNIVYSSRRPGESLEPAPPVDRALPATGQGARTRGAILAGLLGTLIAALGLSVCASGLRAHHRP